MSFVCFVFGVVVFCGVPGGVPVGVPGGVPVGVPGGVSWISSSIISPRSSTDFPLKRFVI